MPWSPRCYNFGISNPLCEVDYVGIEVKVCIVMHVYSNICCYSSKCWSSNWCCAVVHVCLIVWGSPSTLRPLILTSSYTQRLSPLSPDLTLHSHPFHASPHRIAPKTATVWDWNNMTSGFFAEWKIRFLCCDEHSVRRITPKPPINTFSSAPRPPARAQNLAPVASSVRPLARPPSSRPRVRQRPGRPFRPSLPSEQAEPRPPGLQFAPARRVGRIYCA